MIVVDTSVWIDYFNGVNTPESDLLDAALGNQEILVGDLILTEIRREADFTQARQLFHPFPVATMVGPELAIRSAEHYRALRARGVTVRKTIDVMIGTYCIAHDLPLLYADRDFDFMARHLGLQSVIA
jgi:predicted nucleic acid-binding protein